MNDPLFRALCKWLANPENPQPDRGKFGSHWTAEWDMKNADVCFSISCRHRKVSCFWSDSFSIEETKVESESQLLEFLEGIKNG